MRKRVESLAMMLVLILVPGCGASVQATPFTAGKYPPRPADSPVQMFSTKTPSCPYEELGLLRAERDSGLTPWQRVVDAFLARAREMGGDAVILKQGVDLRASGEGELVSEDVLAGTVIRLQSAGCQG